MDALFTNSQRTGDIMVRVVSTFLPERSQPAAGQWLWSYHIRIENHGPVAVQLLSRRWIITDAQGTSHLVEGDGVVGEQPVIQPGGTYDYVSGCPLGTERGSMGGSYSMIDAAGERFRVEIPRFLLEPEEATA